MAAESHGVDNDRTKVLIDITVAAATGAIEGPIVGTFRFFVLRALFADLGSWDARRPGGGTMLAAPKGLWGDLAGRFDLHLVPVQRRVRLLR